MDFCFNSYIVLMKYRHHIFILLFLIITFLSIQAQTTGELDLSNYCTGIRINENTKVSLYTPSMFRVRTSYLKGDKFPQKYEITYLIGKTTNWIPVKFTTVGRS